MEAHVELCHRPWITRIMNQQLKRGREGGGGKVGFSQLFFIVRGKSETQEKKEVKSEHLEIYFILFFLNGQN